MAAKRNPARVSVSDLLPFLDCEYKGRARLLMNAWSAPTAQMRFGTWVHQKAAHLLLPAPGSEDLVLPLEFIDQEPLVKELEDFLWVPPFTVLSTETPLTIPIGDDILVQARIDALIEEDGQVGDLQWKTIGKGKDVGRELERIRMSPHEITYRKAMRLSGINVKWTAVGVLRTYLTKTQQEEKVPRVQLYTLPATQEEDDKAWLDVEASFKRFARGKSSIKNWSACFGSFGRCPLLDHCHNGVSAIDLLTYPLIDRYQDITPDPTQ